MYEGSEPCDTCRPITGGGHTCCLICGLQLGVLRLLARGAVRAG